MTHAMPTGLGGDRAWTAKAQAHQGTADPHDLQADDPQRPQALTEREREKLVGAWGYGYRDNDNYYNEADSFAEPLMAALEARLSEGSSLGDLRAHLMWTVNVLRTTDEEVSLSRDSLDVLREAVRVVRARAGVDAHNWRESEEYLTTVSAELASVE